MAGEALGGAVAARAPLVRAAYARCSRTLKPGEVKRVMQRGPLVGFFLACPACGFSASYLDDAVGFREEPPKEAVLLPGQERDLVGIDRPPPCYRCKRLLRVRDGHLEAVDP